MEGVSHIFILQKPTNIIGHLDNIENIAAQAVDTDVLVTNVRTKDPRLTKTIFPRINFPIYTKHLDVQNASLTTIWDTYYLTLTMRLNLENLDQTKNEST